MSTRYYGLSDNFQNSATTYDATDIVRLHRIVDSQLNGALRVIGEGVVPQPDQTSFLVTPGTGLSVSVAPGMAIISRAALGAVFAELRTATLLSGLTPNSTLYVFVAVQIRVATSDNDTKETSVPVFSVSTSSTLSNGLLLAKVVTTSNAATVTDLRTMQSGDESSLRGSGRVAALDKSIGAPAIVANTLQVKLASGNVYYVGGKRVALATDVFLDVPLSSSVWGVLSLDSSGSVGVTWSSVKPLSGVGIIGKVTSDSTQVTALDLADEDIIQPHWVIQARLRAIIGGTGGGTGIDPTVIVNLQATIQNLLSRLTELEGKSAVGVSSVMTNDERQDAMAMGLALDMLNVNPEHAKTTPMSVLYDGVTGNSENLSPIGNQPDVHAGGNEPIGG